MASEVIKEEATNDTPSFIVDPSAQRITIKGVSMPENSFEFYDPLEKKSLAIFDGKIPALTLDVELTYLNSMSSKQLLKMIKLLASRNPSMKVNWKYHSDDDLIRMKGEEIKTLCPNIQIELSELN
jgi:hypothetical protein